MKGPPQTGRFHPGIRPQLPSHMIPKTLLTLIASGLIAAAAFAQDPLQKQIPAVFDRAAAQYEGMLAKVADDPKLPRTAKADGTVVTVMPEDWVSGFFPGCLWMVYEFNHDAKWKDRAMDYTKRLERIRNFRDHHDTGFMLGCSYGTAMRFDDDKEIRKVLDDGANALATRYVPSLGMIRSWDTKPYICPVIIDNMMNLELLTWAARNGGDPKLKEIALSHADKTLKQHFRADGTAYHVVDYDPKTGWIRATYANQGADNRTAWARGQAWAIYGFTMMFRETGKKEYLEKARSLSDTIMSHPNLPVDKVPYWDFGAEPGEKTPRDASAAAIIASALVELGTLTEDGGRYLDFAGKQLLSLASPAYLSAPGANGGFLLAHSTGHLPVNSEIDVPLVYADYYFLEALLRYDAAMKKTKRPASFGALK